MAGPTKAQLEQRIIELEAELAQFKHCALAPYPDQSQAQQSARPHPSLGWPIRVGLEGKGDAYNPKKK